MSRELLSSMRDVILLQVECQYQAESKRNVQTARSVLLVRVDSETKIAIK